MPLFTPDLSLFTFRCPRSVRCGASLAGLLGSSSSSMLRASFGSAASAQRASHAFFHLMDQELDPSVDRTPSSRLRLLRPPLFKVPPCGAAQCLHVRGSRFSGAQT